ncbi:hypothetical protein Tco_0578270, partial [Tanacetum coccineum]
VTDIAQKDKNEAKWTKPGMGIERVQEIKAEEKHIEREQVAHLAIQKEREEQAAQSFTPYWNFPIIDDDDDEHTIQYSMGDEHLDTILDTKSNGVIKSSVEDLVPILSESEGIFNMCDVPSCDKKHFDAESDLRESLLIRDTSLGTSILSEASPPDSEIVSLEAVRVFDPVDCPDFEGSRARCFVHRSLALQILSMLILGI